MQTFLPLPSIGMSIRCLDNKRLGKQRVEALQILKALRGEYKNGAWVNHPATKMWRGHEDALNFYKDLCIEEWIRRGFKNTMDHSRIHIVKLPPWIGKDEFHASHRSNLLRKDAAHYSQFNWGEPDDLPYVWPIS
jgi:hypothetical protein|tara:strand:+ start:8274 stop:8678 length:405 start_codon:yes stop_codon:yes gene_type:complete